MYTETVTLVSRLSVSVGDKTVVHVPRDQESTVDDPRLVMAQFGTVRLFRVLMMGDDAVVCIGNCGSVGGFYG